MIVPQFWAEARVQQPRGPQQRQITVRRFGWSEVSQIEAEAMARQRAQAALATIASGGSLARTEPKVAYNGAEGVPIREEIVARHGDVVITRNAYGAHCLNTPDVFFADIDFDDQPMGRMLLASAIVLLAAALIIGIQFGSDKLTFALVFAALLVFYPVAAGATKVWIALRGGPERIAYRRIDVFLKRHGDWHLALYRTPAGLRVLALHDVFDPREARVEDCFSALGVDRLYAKMCRNQRCFRARVSPKPWRIGIAAHMRPRPGVWPVNPARLPLRNAWIRDYEAAAQHFASCRFLKTLGSGATHARAETVRALHDRLAQALTERAIA